MLVLVLMFEARKPQNWAWMGFTDFEPNIDTRYLSNIYGEPTVAPVQEENASNGKTPNQAQQEFATKQQNKSDEEEQEFAKAEKGFWDSNYEKLNFRQRMLLFEGLYRARNSESLADTKQSEWMRMVDEFEIANNIYQADIVKYLAAISESDPRRKKLSSVLFEFQARWERYAPILKAIGSSPTQEPIDVNPDSNNQLENKKQLDESNIKSSEFELESLVQLQAVIDRTAFGFVRDNALQSFKDDHPAMIRLIDKIQSGDFKNLPKDNESKIAESKKVGINRQPEEVMFAQLYKETERLRGKEVLFAGEIRGAYSAKIDNNYLGVTQLYVYWVQISGAQNPVAVYSLNPINGFAIPLTPLNNESATDIREPVDVTGVLFQKMVYAANDVNRIAPVVFTSIPNWKPEKKAAEKERELPGLTYLVAAFLGIGGIFAIGTWFFMSLGGKKHQKQVEELKRKFQVDTSETTPASTDNDATSRENKRDGDVENETEIAGNKRSGTGSDDIVQ